MRASLFSFCRDQCGSMGPSRCRYFFVPKSDTTAFDFCYYYESCTAMTQTENVTDGDFFFLAGAAGHAAHLGFSEIFGGPTSITCLHRQEWVHDQDTSSEVPSNEEAVSTPARELLFRTRVCRDRCAKVAECNFFSIQQTAPYICSTRDVCVPESSSHNLYRTYLALPGAISDATSWAPRHYMPPPLSHCKRQDHLITTAEACRSSWEDLGFQGPSSDSSSGHMVGCQRNHSSNSLVFNPTTASERNHDAGAHVDHRALCNLKTTDILKFYVNLESRMCRGSGKRMWLDSPIDGRMLTIGNSSTRALSVQSWCQNIQLPFEIGNAASNGNFNDSVRYDFLVDWGDSSEREIYSSSVGFLTHRYELPGVYVISIQGNMDGLPVNGNPYANASLENFARSFKGVKWTSRPYSYRLSYNNLSDPLQSILAMSFVVVRVAGFLGVR